MRMLVRSSNSTRMGLMSQPKKPAKNCSQYKISLFPSACWRPSSSSQLSPTSTSTSQFVYESPSFQWAPRLRQSYWIFAATSTNPTSYQFGKQSNAYAPQQQQDTWYSPGGCNEKTGVDCHIKSLRASEWEIPMHCVWDTLSIYQISRHRAGPILGPSFTLTNLLHLRQSIV